MTNRFLDAPFSRSNSFAIASLQIGVIGAFFLLWKANLSSNVSASGGIISFLCTSILRREKFGWRILWRKDLESCDGIDVWTRFLRALDTMQKGILVFLMNNGNSCGRTIYAVSSRRHTLLGNFRHTNIYICLPWFVTSCIGASNYQSKFMNASNVEIEDFFLLFYCSTMICPINFRRNKTLKVSS